MGSETRNTFRNVRNVLRVVNNHRETSDGSAIARGGYEKHRSDKPPVAEPPPETPQPPYSYYQQVSEGRGYSVQGASYPAYPAQGFPSQGSPSQGNQAQPSYGSGYGYSPPQAPLGQAQSYYNQHPQSTSQGYPEHPYGFSQNPPHNAHTGFPPDRPGPHQSQSDYNANTQQYSQNQGFNQYSPDTRSSPGHLRRMDTAPAASTYEHQPQPCDYSQNHSYNNTGHNANAQHQQWNQGISQYGSGPEPSRRDTAPAAGECRHGTPSDSSYVPQYTLTQSCDKVSSPNNTCNNH